MYLAGTNKAVDTGDTYFGEIGKYGISGSVIAREKLDRDRIKTLEIIDAKPLEARIEHARWIVDCPNCSGAEFLFEDKLFLCSLCKNSNIQGKVRRVNLPPRRKEFEDLLSKRFIKNRHWTNETIEDLKAENLKMGVI